MHTENYLQQPQTWTLMSALETIMSLAENSKMSADFLKLIEEPTSYVSDVLQITPTQCVMIAVLLDSGDALTLSKIGQFLDCSNLKMLNYENELNELHKRQYLKWSAWERRECIGYHIHPDLLNSIKQNKPYIPKPYSEFSTIEVIQQIDKWLKFIERQENLTNLILETIKSFFKETEHLSFSKKISQIDLFESELIVLLLAICKNVCEGVDCITKRDIMNILDMRKALFITTILNSRKANLVKYELLENCFNDGMSDISSYQLTDKAWDTLLQDLKDFRKEDHSMNEGLIEPQEIIEKALFFNEREGKEIERLNGLLSQEQFPVIQQRLADANMRKGFACLFYGAPGTGKTESVLQLCRKTGRAILQVDISQMKSKWVGESEKRIQAIFNKYEKLVKCSKVCPVLLFNEADAVISKRSSNVDRAVEKMENACQNIILQSMEKLSGIMIATSNLTSNMDSAFERRFIYKVKFDKPQPQVKSKIWQSMLPELKEEEACSLASSFDFSGGQIENIARKQAVESILYGKSTSLSELKSLCEAENICSSRNYIGFNCN